MKTKIFVYGTLKSGHHNHRLLHGQEFIGQAETCDLKVMHCTGIPFLHDYGGYYYNDKLCKGHHVTGEVYLVDKQALQMMDALEGHPRWYRRCPIRLRAKQGDNPMEYTRFMAEAYFMPPEKTKEGLPYFTKAGVRRTF